MPHTVIFNPDIQIIEITVKGDFDYAEAKEMVSKSAHIAKEQNCFSVLGDAREATPKLSILEIYEFSKSISSIYTSQGLQANKFKRAFVITKKSKEFEFFETVRINRGQKIRLFFDIDEAKKWLIEN